MKDDDVKNLEATDGNKLVRLSEREGRDLLNEDLDIVELSINEVQSSNKGLISVYVNDINDLAILSWILSRSLLQVQPPLALPDSEHPSVAASVDDFEYRDKVGIKCLKLYLQALQARFAISIHCLNDTRTTEDFE